jgi:hypothetical protein
MYPRPVAARPASCQILGLHLATPVFSGVSSIPRLGSGAPDRISDTPVPGPAPIRRAPSAA